MNNFYQLAYHYVHREELLKKKREYDNKTYKCPNCERILYNKQRAHHKKKCKDKTFDEFFEIVKNPIGDIIFCKLG